MFLRCQQWSWASQAPCSYQMALEYGQLWHWHIDQLRSQVGDLDATNVPLTGPMRTDQQPGDSGPRQPTPQAENSGSSGASPVLGWGSSRRPSIVDSSVAAVPTVSDSVAATATPAIPKDFGVSATLDAGLYQSVWVTWHPAYLKDNGVWAEWCIYAT